MIALPSLASGLETDILGISWAIISFQLAAISLSVIFGRLGDIYGRRTLYLLGFAILIISSLLCGFSQNVSQLILFRFLQGVGAAMTQSVARALAMEAVPEGSEGKAQAFMTMSFHTGFFLGPAIGGFIIEYINWRWIFFFLVPFGLAGLILSIVGSKKRPERKTPGVRPSIDYGGAALLIGLSFLLILLIDRRAAEVLGINQKSLLGLVFLVTLWGFLAHEWKTPSPIVNLSLFKIRMFSCSVIALLTLSTTRGLVGFLMPFYLQGILFISPISMGFIFLAPPIFTIALSPLCGYLTDKVGPRIPATAGVIVSIAVLVVGATLKVDSHWILPTIMMGMTGIGTAFFNSANQASLIGSVPKEHRGFANGMVHMTFGLGHMLGVSVGGLLLTIAFRYYSGDLTSMPDPGNPSAFVLSVNATYRLAISLGFVALLSSVLRGGGKVKAARAQEH